MTLAELSKAHSYHQEQGCYYSNKCHFHYETWSDFMDEWSDAGVDYNRVIRWDWHVPDKDEIEEAKEELANDGELPIWGHEHVKIYFMLQRKARPISCYVEVTAEDDAAVREYLKPHAEYSKQLWEGIL